MIAQYILQRRKMGMFFIRSGGILLIVDGILWVSQLKLVFFFGIPFIFVGGVLLSLGLMILCTPRQRSGRLILLSGLITLAGGLLAIMIPQMLVTPGSGDTLLGWMAGLTILLTGIPMTALGGSILFVGLVIAVQQHLHQASQRPQH